MPVAYRDAHSAAEIQAHLEIVARRGDARVHLESCPELGSEDGPLADEQLTFLAPDQTHCVCVIADDQAGLISSISCAMLSHSLDVVKAHMFCREHGDKTEAVDFIWFRAPKASASNPVQVDLTLVRKTIEDLVSEQSLDTREEMDSMIRQAAPTRPPPANDALTRPEVYFDFSRAVLVVESRDRRGLLLAITLAVFREGLVIQGSTVTTLDGIARDEFEVTEADGTLLSDEQRVKLVQRVRQSVLR